MPLAAFPKCFLDDLCVHRSMTVDQWIELALPLDIDGLEFYWGFIPEADPKEWERLRRKVDQQQRSIPMLCYSSDFTKPSLAERKAEIQKQQRAIIAAAGLGAKYCRVLSGQRRPDVTRPQGLKWVQECILALIPFAESNRVILILENHYKDSFWQYPEFAQKTDVFVELLDGIPDSPSFGVNYDPSNAVIAGEDPIQLLESVKLRLKTMHASDRYFEGGTWEDLRRMETQAQTGYASILKHGVIGRGLNDYDRIFSILKSVGFNGWISIEDGPDPKTGLDDIAQSAVFLRRKMGEYGLS